ncbi:hypothetical protein PYW08_004928 [Mythimna loreyi]|uniref:Uncharacterized protein n=1 Tax=Mythimna loreyi TaxID=667449 RepID=A0ACC2QDK5_9NEOP|nr:hypothetical protein PYW08_004928 [Mythimna loreyi]
MADAAAARREARRRRILENSHNRLQLISGKCGDEGPRESPVRNIIPDSTPEISHSSVNSSSKTSLNNGVIIPEPDSFELLSSFNHDIASGDRELEWLHHPCSDDLTLKKEHFEELCFLYSNLD